MTFNTEDGKSQFFAKHKIFSRGGHDAKSVVKYSSVGIVKRLSRCLNEKKGYNRYDVMLF